jgi:carboxyl-terminal processing protease
VRRFQWIGYGLALVVFLVAGVLLGIGIERRWLSAGIIPASGRSESDTIDYNLVDEAYGLIQRYYVDQSAVQSQPLTYGAIGGMIESLGDTGHSRFLSPEHLQAENQQLSGELEGIGVHVEQRDGAVTVVAPIDGSPADLAGIRAGDIIMRVNGEDISGLTLGEVVSRITGPSGTEVTVTIFRPETNATRDYTLKRARIQVNNVTWKQLPGTQIAHLRISEYTAGVGRDLKNALREIQQQGLTGIVLDVRDNRGGRLDEAINVVSQFVRDGLVLQERDARGNIKEVPVEHGGVAYDIPMVVLVNQGTASAAEITAGALQDAGRARLVGQTTFGAGTVLNTFPLSDGSALLLAVEEWLTPTGRKIWHVGIEPDEIVELPADVVALIPLREDGLTAETLRSSGDTQLLKALELLGQPAFAPGS